MNIPLGYLLLFVVQEHQSSAVFFNSSVCTRGAAGSRVLIAEGVDGVRDKGPGDNYNGQCTFIEGFLNMSLRSVSTAEISEFLECQLLD
jgi:hypothetical protein